MRTTDNQTAPRHLHDVRHGPLTPMAESIEQMLLETHADSFTSAGMEVAKRRKCSFENVRKTYNKRLLNNPMCLRLPAEHFADNADFLQKALIICRKYPTASRMSLVSAMVETMPPGWADPWPNWLIAREIEMVRSTAADVWTNIGHNRMWHASKMEAVSAFLFVTKANKARAEEMSGIHRAEVAAVFAGHGNVRSQSLLLVLASVGIQVALADGTGALLDLSSGDSCGNVVKLAKQLGWHPSGGEA